MAEYRPPSGRSRNPWSLKLTAPLTSKPRPTRPAAAIAAAGLSRTRVATTIAVIAITVDNTNATAVVSMGPVSGSASSMMSRTAAVASTSQARRGGE